MSSSQRILSSPWPSPTEPPSPSSLKRRRYVDRRSKATPERVDSQSRSLVMVRDNIVTDQAEVQAAMTQCETFSGNDVYSCWPTEDTVVPQHQFASFVWNSRLPQFAQTNAVNIYLLHGDTQEQILAILNQPNPTDQAGLIHAQVNDTWFGSRGSEWDGQNVTFPYFWVVTRNDTTLGAADIAQPTFTAVQTTFADSVVASMTSASAASSRSAASASAASASAASASAASASAASASAAAAASASATMTSLSPNPSGISANGTNANNPSSTSTSVTGNIQPNNGTSFPRWAIAVIVVLGFLALVASGVLTFFVMRRLRNRRNSNLSHRGSMNSASPMMANVQTGNTPQSPLLGGAVLAGAVGGGSQRPTSPADMHDGASTMSRVSEAAPFSGADAAIMADAFRKALRKPDFASRPVEEGESPDDRLDDPGSGVLINRELAEEGRDIRSVSSSRGVRVETLSDDGATTTQDDPH